MDWVKVVETLEDREALCYRKIDLCEKAKREGSGADWADRSIGNWATALQVLQGVRVALEAGLKTEDHETPPEEDKQ